MYSQEEGEKIVDSLYREDQFYAGVTYNLLGKMPSGVSQNGFSSGFHLGFIRDMPINEKRNIAFGLGVGYSTNSFNQNILIRVMISLLLMMILNLQRINSHSIWLRFHLNLDGDLRHLQNINFGEFIRALN